MSVFELKNLIILSLSSNKFNGTMQLDLIQRLGSLTKLDLSYNSLAVIVSDWIWEVCNGSLTHLNLSRNSLVGLQEPFSILSLTVLDLHSNWLQGKIPPPPPFAVYVDYSNNNFSNSIPHDIGNLFSMTLFFSLSNNKLTGVIPKSICEATYLQVLDLSSNNLSGSIPACLIQRSK